MSQKNPDLTTVYTAPGCQGCRMTQQALARAGVTYATVDLSHHPELVEEFRAQGLRQAPIISTPDGVRTSGFDPDRIKAIVAATRDSTPAPDTQVEAGWEQ